MITSPLSEQMCCYVAILKSHQLQLLYIENDTKEGEREREGQTDGFNGEKKKKESRK